MPNRLLRLAVPAALAVASSCFATAPALARPVTPHSHQIPFVSGNLPGVQAQPVSFPAPSYSVSTDAQLTSALQNAQPGQVIHLASGATFSQITDTKARAGWVTLSGAGDAQAPVIQGARLMGSQFLRVTNVMFDRQVLVTNSPMKKYAQPSDDIQLINDEMDCGATQTVGGGIAIEVRGGSQNVAIVGDYVHDCTVGFSSVAQDDQSTNIAITHDTFQDFYGDAIDLGAMRNLSIDHDVIQDIQRSPGVTYHDDGIQFFGNDTNVAITNNVIDNSLDQLLFIQDAVKGLNNNSSVNSNILVENNLMYGNCAFAVQAQGALQTRFIDNTIWDNGDGSLLLRKSGYTGIAPTDTVVTGNVLESFATSGVHPAVESNNVILHAPSGFTPGPGDVIGETPSFANSAAGDFQITSPATTATPAGSAAASASSTIPTTVGSNLSAASPAGWGAPQFGL